MEINDQELTQLRESAAKANQLQGQVILLVAKEAARGVMSGLLAASKLPVVAQKRVEGILLSNLPIKEGALDAAMFATQVTSAIQAETEYLKEAAPAPVASSAKPSGMGEGNTTASGNEKLDLAEAQKIIDASITVLSGVNKEAK